ncbi:MAG: NADH-quinone oxidoreductase subunit H [Actinobacteria bacterium]|nr:NADH-quinone oxidoreductase subunit H [Actinomycetota bacterium]
MVAAVVVSAVLGVGAYAVAALETGIGARVAGHPLGVTASLRAPLAQAALLLARPAVVTERPDGPLWVLAPALYAALAATALSVLPLATDFAVADVRTGIVVFGSAEVLAMVAVYLHGWAPNSPLPLVGAYRFIASGCSFLLLSMFVLIAAALPAESMSFGRIMASQQEGLWNVLRQPLGLPLFAVVALGVSFFGPLDFSDGHELAGGTAAEVSGPPALAWGWARRAMLATYAIASAVVFLAGPSGPWLPGPLWLALKALAIAAALVWLRHTVGRVQIDRFVLVAWTVLLPLAFLHLAIAGVVTLA